MELTTEEQKLLTEWLGEEWRENTWYHVYEDADLIRLDFSDWGVVGRLVAKVTSFCLQSESHSTERANLCLLQMSIESALWEDTPQLAICHAVLAYLKEKE